MKELLAELLLAITAILTATLITMAAFYLMTLIAMVVGVIVDQQIIFALSILVLILTATTAKKG